MAGGCLVVHHGNQLVSLQHLVVVEVVGLKHAVGVVVVLDIAVFKGNALELFVRPLHVGIVGFGDFDALGHCGKMLELFHIVQGDGFLVAFFLRGAEEFFRRFVEEDGAEFVLAFGKISVAFVVDFPRIALSHGIGKGQEKCKNGYCKTLHNFQI